MFGAAANGNIEMMELLRTLKVPMDILHQERSLSTVASHTDDYLYSVIYIVKASISLINAL